MRLRSLVLAACATFLLAACSDEVALPPATQPPESVSQLDPLFASASREFNVPADLLKAVGYVETRWQMVRGEVEFEGMPPAFGIMALRGERLQLAARLARVPVSAVRSTPAANIRGAAALLSAYAEEMKLDRADLAAWAPAVVRYSGIENADAQTGYVYGEVYAALRAGVSDPNLGVSIPPRRTNLPLATPGGGPRLALAPDYPVSGTIWRPSPWYTERPAGDIGKPHMVIIHTCESSYSSCWSWLTSPDNTYKTSAHYVVNESGTEISQLVYESKRAHHIGASYDCANNSGHECWRNGYSSNDFTVGIEHGGYASQTSFPAGQIDASARLACDISKAHNIPRDRYHFVAHGQLQPYNRTDPGANWPWTDYLNKINSYCSSPVALSAGMAVASWDVGRLDVFARGSNNAVYQKWFVSGGEWSGWGNLGGNIASDPAAVSWAPGRIDVFARGTDNTLHQKYFVSGTGWSGWQSLGGNLASAPTVSSWGPGRLDVFARGTDNTLLHKYFVSGTGWSGWQSLGGALTSDPAAVSWSSGRIDVFVRGTDNALHQKYFVSGSGWSGWVNHGGILTSAPAVASQEPGRLDVFIRGGDNVPYQKYFASGKWSAWVNMGGQIASKPAAVSWGAGRLDVFARGMNNDMYQKYFSNGWYPWTNKGAIP